MILNHITDSIRCETLHPLFARAFDILRTVDWSREKTGRQVIVPEQLYLIVSDDTGRGRETARLEAHRRFVDIQYVTLGIEVIGWSHLRDAGETTQPYDDGKDIAFFADKPHAWMELHPGDFAIFFPEDAHAPLAGNEPIRKVIVKVKM